MIFGNDPKLLVTRNFMVIKPLIGYVLMINVTRVRSPTGNDDEENKASYGGKISGKDIAHMLIPKKF